LLKYITQCAIVKFIHIYYVVSECNFFGSMASQDEVGKTIDQSIVSVINGFIQIQVFSYTGDFAAGSLL
jgi:hypothetical protein